MNNWAIILLAMVWLGGCTRVATMDTPLLPGAAAPPESWGVVVEGRAGTDAAVLRDPYLTDLVELALMQNPDLAGTRARVDQARSLVAEGRAGLWPSLRLNASLSEEGDLDVGGEGGRGALTISPSWEADLWGRLEAGRSAAEFDLSAARADLDAARLTLAVLVAEAYVLAVAARLQSQVAADTFERLSATLGFIEVQAERGLRSGQDLALIRADVETARARRISTQAAERAALRALNLLLGAYPASSRDIAPDLPAIPVISETGVPADLLRQRPDLVALEYRVRAAARRVHGARADRLPRLILSGSLTAQSNAPASLFDPTSLGWRVLAELSAPVMDGGLRRARIDARRAEVAEAVARYQEGALAAFGEAEGALDLAVVLSEQQDALAQARAEARRALAFVQYRFEVGDGDLLDVLAVQNRVASLDAAVVAVRQQRLEAYLDLTLALGGFPFS